MGNTINAERERGLSEPLMAVTVVNGFCATLWWVHFRDQEESLMKGAPFRLIRHGVLFFGRLRSESSIVYLRSLRGAEWGDCFECERFGHCEAIHVPNGSRYN